MINQGPPPGGPANPLWWLWYQQQSADQGGGGAPDPYAQYPISINGVPQGTDYGYGVPGDPNYFRDDPGPQPSGTPGYWNEREGGPGYPSQGGYYGTDGGMGYIHGGPANDQEAWQLFLEMNRNGWEVSSPFGVDEARRGMGQYTEEKWRDYFLNDWIPTHTKEDGSIDYGPVNDWVLKLLGKGKLGMLGIDDWIKNMQKNATADDWINSLTDDQYRYINDWMLGQGADKNWRDRVLQGDAPWSRGNEAIDKTGTQNPREPGDPREPRPGGGPRDRPETPEDPGGSEGDGPGYTGPLGLPSYSGMAFKPEFLAYQPYNTNGPVQFVPGRS